MPVEREVPEERLDKVLEMEALLGDELAVVSKRPSSMEGDRFSVVLGDELKMLREHFLDADVELLAGVDLLLTGVRHVISEAR